ncbi:hypothetical protein PIB30_053088 [Stylosanthes scabra]|uniref:Uncharacterized protein n=1 Tax=Stylosanthes scabra TaxID=79078 RepID=A0ABU6QIS8_9FABA|nr:hypothetical protein [Stylosanthes scabra]
MPWSRRGPTRIEVGRDAGRYQFMRDARVRRSAALILLADRTVQITSGRMNKPTRDSGLVAARPVDFDDEVGCKILGTA